MNNKNGTNHEGLSPAWVTHSYPAGEHPAAPAPEPAPFWAEAEETPAGYESAAEDCRNGGEVR